MARWLLLALASAVCADAERPARYADYSAARMPQYDTLYDARAASEPTEEYRDRSDAAAPMDYNTYDQESNDRRSRKSLHEEDIYQLPSHNKLRKEPTTPLDDIDADYSLKSEENLLKNKISNKRLRNSNVMEAIDSDNRRPKIIRNAKKIQYNTKDDEDIEAPLEHLEDEKNFESDSEKSKYVRRDIRPKVRRKPLYPKSTLLRDPDYDEQGDIRQGKDMKKFEGPLYTDPELSQNAPNIESDDTKLEERARPPGNKIASEDKDGSEVDPSRRHKAPMPKPRKKNTDYVDYNDMSRIEEIKNLPTRSTVSARTGASRRWSFQDGFRRRFFNSPPQEAAEYAEILTHKEHSETLAALNVTTPSPLPPPPGFDEPIAPLTKDQIQNITAFVNMTKQASKLSIAEMSQLSILKKAQRKDSVKDELLKDKPPVLLQVTERLQTVVMVEPPPSTQEPWLRARDIAEDSPERIAKVKRFMRNKLVANARNISELMENWDDTVCDYVDISLLDENGAVWVHKPYMPLLKLVSYTLAAYFTRCLLWSDPVN